MPHPFDGVPFLVEREFVTAEVRAKRGTGVRRYPLRLSPARAGTCQGMTTPENPAPEPENPDVKQGEITKTASDREPDVDTEEVPYAPGEPGDPDNGSTPEDPGPDEKPGQMPDHDTEVGA